MEEENNLTTKMKENRKTLINKWIRKNKIKIIKTRI